MGLCPFPDHNEKTPSFSVSQDKQLYHCFGCGKSGNVYTFVQHFYGFSFYEAVEYLAKQNSIPLPKTYGGNEKNESDSREKKVILNLALEFYCNTLANLHGSHGAKQYLVSRGMGDPETLKTLKLGWAPDEWSRFADLISKKNYSLEKAADLGLVKRRKDGKGYFDLFRSRVMFPVFSFSGEVLGFGGRVLGDEKPKYLNSPESSVFKKSRILYGQNWASPFIRKNDQAIIVEGYTDWISLYLADFKNVLATMGTALTLEHAQRLKRWCSKALCIFDGDEAGHRASERALKHLFQGEVLGRAVFLPDGSDPDSFLKNEGVDGLREEIKNARDLFLSLLDRKMLGYQGEVHEKLEILNWAVEMLSHLPQRSSLLKIYVGELETRTELGTSTIWSELKKKIEDPRSKASLKPAPPSQQVKKEAAPKKMVAIQAKKSDPEFIAFNLALGFQGGIDLIEESKIDFKDRGLASLWEILLESRRQGLIKSGSVEGFLAGYCSNPEALTLSLEKPYSLLSQEQKIKMIEECLQSMKNLQLRDRSKSLRDKLGHSSEESELEQFMNIQRQRRELKQ